MAPLLLHYPIAEHTLGNGLRVLVNADPASPAVALNLWYGVGSADEAASRTGFAHLFEHLMFQGSANVASGDHLASMQAAGGHVNATTSFDRTNYFETTPPGALELALWLEADRMESLTVDQTNLDNQRDVVKEEKRQRYDNVPYGDVLQLLLALHFPEDHPYHHTPIGSLAHLDAAHLGDVQGFYHAWYTPSDATLVISGAVNQDAAFALVEAAFGHIPGRPAPHHARPEALPAHHGVPRAVVRRPVPRDAVHVGWRTPPITHPEHLAVAQALSILGDGQSARLHRLLVRDQELSEGIGTAEFDLARGTSLALVSARAREGVDIARLEHAVVTEVERLGAEGPTTAELDRIHAGYERDWLLELASLDSRADQINSYAVLHGHAQGVNTHLAEYLSVSPEDVAKAARDWLTPSACAVLDYRVGDEEAAS
ncbi:MAG TPA: pitrilysin family protein [Propionibacteriaceae bacterium]|nr:pitrilysin family protein [Propionibacteriaceae bacterium]